MNTILAYLTVVLVWSTTPIAIRFSVVDDDYSSPLLIRSLIGLLLTVFCLSFVNARIELERRALLTYLFSAMSIFVSMLLTYWAARFVGAGEIAICYALSPIITALLAIRVLGERPLNVTQTAGIVAALLGLYICFGNQFNLRAVDQEQAGGEYVIALASLLIAVFVHALSAVLVKRFGSKSNPLSVNAGSLLLACCFLLIPVSWGDNEFSLPSNTAFQATVYLGVVGSFVGFILYLYILRKLSASKAMSVPVVTPVLAMLLAHFIFQEPLTISILTGGVLVALGLAVFLLGGRHPVTDSNTLPNVVKPN